VRFEQWRLAILEFCGQQLDHSLVDGRDGTLPVYKCNILSEENSRHHYQLYVTMNFRSHTITYETFIVDGVTVYSDIANKYDALAYVGMPTINVEQQIDNHTADVTDSEYLDHYNLWVR